MQNQDGNSRPEPLSHLRRRAEAVIDKAVQPEKVAGTLEDMQRLIAELHIHQIELEMQNEELRQAQSQLATEREKYVDLYNFAPVAYVTVDDNDIIIDLNHAAAELLEHEFRFMEGRPITSHLTPDSLQTYFEHRQFTLESRSAQTCQLTIRRRDGTKAVVQARTVALNPSADTRQLWRTVLTDITALKEAEEALRLKDRAMETSINALAISNLDGKITYVNPAFLTLWGHENIQTVIGQPVSAFWEFEEDAEEIVQALMRDGGWMGERNALRKNGSIFIAQISASLVTNEAHKPTCMMASFIDITERKYAEQALKRSLEEKEVLMKELQHRTKNSLNVVASLLSMEKNGLKDKHSQEIFDSTERRIHSIAAVYDQLYRSGSLDKINLHTYIQQLTDDLHDSYFPISGLVSIETQLEPIQLDLKRALPLGLILNELITNALKYAFPNGRTGKIHMELTQVNESISLCITDNGVGMDCTAKLESGSGMGLRLVKMLSAQLNGSFSLECEGKTMACVCFPV